MKLVRHNEFYVYLCTDWCRGLPASYAKLICPLVHILRPLFNHTYIHTSLHHLLSLVQSHCLYLSDTLYAITCNKTSLYLTVVLQPVTITCNLRHLKVLLYSYQIYSFFLTLLAGSGLCTSRRPMRCLPQGTYEFCQ